MSTTPVHIQPGLDYEDVNITPTNPPPYETRAVTGPTLDPARLGYFTPPLLPDERKKRKASQDREYSTSIGKKDLTAPAEKKVIIDLNSSTLDGAVGGLDYRQRSSVTIDDKSDSDSTTESSDSDSDSPNNSQIAMDLDSTFSLFEDPEKVAVVEKAFKDVGGPPVSDWIRLMELTKASQIELAKRQADMASASYDPKNITKLVLKPTVATGRFLPPNPILSASNNIAQPSNIQGNPPNPCRRSDTTRVI